jgi:hypothetical protein
MEVAPGTPILIDKDGRKTACHQSVIERDYEEISNG